MLWGEYSLFHPIAAPVNACFFGGASLFGRGGGDGGYPSAPAARYRAGGFFIARGRRVCNCYDFAGYSRPGFADVGLSLSTPATVSLLNNFEIVATALIAWLVFKEAVGKRIWLALALITAASLVLSVADWSDFSFSAGALLALAACICWGMENNCTRMLSLKNPLQIVWVKGLGSGGGALLLAAVCGRVGWQAGAIVEALLLGAVAYGGSVYFYILAQRNLGAARTGAYYALAPFVGVFLSFVLVGQELTRSFVIALILMAAGTYLAVCEKHNHQHTHESLAHCHRHNHQDGHHTHTHSYPVVGEHCHYHVHEPLTHSHEHRPDLHHAHTHVQ